MSILYLTFKNPVFTDYAFYSTSSIANLMSMAALTVWKRSSANTYDNPEGLAFIAQHQSTTGSINSDVERVRRNHLNDIENVVPFVFIGLFYVATNPNRNIAYWHFRLFFLSRLAYTICSQMPLPQPGRFISFSIGYLTTLSMAFQALFHSM